MLGALWIKRLDRGARCHLPALAQAIGKTCAGADQARGDGVYRTIEDSPGVLVVETLAIDEKQRAALLRRQLAKEVGRHVVDELVGIKERLEARFDLGLAHRLGMIAKLLQPEPVNLGEGPSVERRATLIAILLGEHALEGAAEKRRAVLLVADENIGKALQPGQKNDEPLPKGIMALACLNHAAFPTAWMRVGPLRKFSPANHKVSTFRFLAGTQLVAG